MASKMKPLGIGTLIVEKRLAPVQEIWDRITADSNTVPLTDPQRTELERGYVDNEAFPNDVVSWE